MEKHALAATPQQRGQEVTSGGNLLRTIEAAALHEL
jgi:hypothetical protein